MGYTQFPSSRIRINDLPEEGNLGEMYSEGLSTEMMLHPDRSRAAQRCSPLNGSSLVLQQLSSCGSAAEVQLLLPPLLGLALAVGTAHYHRFIGKGGLFFPFFPLFEQ